MVECLNGGMVDVLRYRLICFYTGTDYLMDLLID